MTIADRLRELRGSQSQKAAAIACGIRQQVWNRYEKGEVLPGAESIINICRVFNVSADELLGISPSSCGVAVSGSGNAVAIGTGAKASARTVHTAKRESDCCAKCPHKILADAVRKAAAK